MTSSSQTLVSIPRTICSQRIPDCRWPRIHEHLHQRYDQLLGHVLTQVQIPLRKGSPRLPRLFIFLLSYSLQQNGPKKFPVFATPRHSKQPKYLPERSGRVATIKRIQKRLEKPRRVIKALSNRLEEQMRERPPAREATWEHLHRQPLQWTA